MTQFKEPNAGTAICAQGSAKLLHIARLTKDGVELRTSFWFPAQAKVPMVMLKGLNLHAVEKYLNLAEILLSIYKEYGQK